MRRRLTWTTLLMLNLAWMGCTSADGTADAETADTATPSSPGTPTPAADLPEGAEQMALNSGNTSITFWAEKLNGQGHDGGFTGISGIIAYERDSGELLAINVEIEMATAYTDAGGLTGHLKNQDFFLVSEYPTGTFVSTAIEPTGDGKANVTGNLTIRDQSHSLTFPIEYNVNPAGVVLTAEFQMLRDQQGMTYGADMIRNEIDMKIAVDPAGVAE